MFRSQVSATQNESILEALLDSYVRLIFVEEDAPESARHVPQDEWLDERNPDRIAQMLGESAAAVREAVQSKLESGKEMNLHYDHPILFSST